MVERRTKLKKIVSGETQNHFEELGGMCSMDNDGVVQHKLPDHLSLVSCDLTIQVYEGNEEKTTNSPVDQLI